MARRAPPASRAGPSSLAAAPHVHEFLYDDKEQGLGAGLEPDEPDDWAGPDGPPQPDEFDFDAGAVAEEIAAADAAEAAFARSEVQFLRARGTDVGDPTGTPCVHCGSGVSGPFIEAFGIAACHPCRARMATSYKLVTRAFCKAELVLTDKQLDRLGSLKVPNPHKKSFNAMRLYLRVQAEEVALTTWGSAAAIEAEHRRRDEVKLARASDKAKRPRAVLPVGAGGARAAPRASAVAGGTPTDGGAKRPRAQGVGSAAASHEHLFDGVEELVDAVNDLYKRTCTLCKCVCTYEKL
ncbi:hypothetical protein T492DRAFT_833658 [Pavlovales sp. CCMP2436]|nr:hypothetical protein T492DRAFT_833658 [Pavlovales sp. CCMP2436]